jgi:GntR family transcriptional repressor for pyruvate dehydrogenase complex
LLPSAFARGLDRSTLKIIPLSYKLLSDTTSSIRKAKHVFERLTAANKKSVQVAEQILKLLKGGHLATGERLPTEREMIDQLGVSRTVLREALSALQLTGYLGSRPGYGHYVRKIPVEPEIGAGSIEGLEAGLSVIEAIEARAALDFSVVCLAVKHATPEDLAHADDILKQMAEALEDGEYRRYATLSLDFHEALAAATGSAFVQRTVANLIEIVRHSVWLIARNYDPAKGAYSLDVHRQMLNGIREHALDTAVEAVWAHYHDYPSLREAAGEDAQPGAAEPGEIS